MRRLSPVGCLPGHRSGGAGRKLLFADQPVCGGAASNSNSLSPDLIGPVEAAFHALAIISAASTAAVRELLMQISLNGLQLLCPGSPRTTGDDAEQGQ